MSPNPSMFEDYDKSGIKYPFGKALSEFSYDLGNNNHLKRDSRANSIAGSLEGNEDASLFIAKEKNFSEVDSDYNRRKKANELMKEFDKQPA